MNLSKFLEYTKRSVWDGKFHRTGNDTALGAWHNHLGACQTEPCASGEDKEVDTEAHYERL